MLAPKLSTRTVACLAILTSMLALAGVAYADSHDEELASMRYVPPISQPFLNEPPQNTTELRPIYIYNKQPKSFYRSGHTNIVSLQLRYAITERLGLIITKNGWADFNTSSRSQLDQDEGWLNLAFGLKWAWLNNVADNSFFSLGLRYEAPSGDLNSGGLARSLLPQVDDGMGGLMPDPTVDADERVKLSMQGNGDGFINVFATGHWLYRDKIGIQTIFGLNQAIDTTNNSSFVHWSLHGDYEIFRNAFLVMETNMIASADEGSRTVARRNDADATPIKLSEIKTSEGNDLVNLGSDDPGTVITYAAGARYRFSDHFLLGFGYEVPLLQGRKDMLDYRFMFDAVLRL